jgi:hypothetical protein
MDLKESVGSKTLRGAVAGGCLEGIENVPKELWVIKINHHPRWHNHDISFIVTQCKSMAIVYYVTNYATKIEDPMWKRVAAVAESLQAIGDSEQQASIVDGRTNNITGQNRTRQFLMKVANRIFTERALSQVEVVANLLGYDMEFASNSAWTFLNVSSLYWHIFR